MNAPRAVVVAAPSAWQRATRSGGLAIGLALALAMVLVALAAPWLAPYDPNAQDVLLKLEPPSAAHPFGTDDFGRDVLSRVIYGSRISLFVGAIATLAGVLAGTTVTRQPTSRSWRRMLSLMPKS